MLSYETLDMIADSVTPVIGILSLGHLALLILRRNQSSKVTIGGSFWLLLFGILLTYLIMFLDNAFGVWPSFGLDYSTHTALAWVFIVYLCRLSRAALFGFGSLMLAYMALMRYQNYHTVLDMLTTTACLLPCLLYLAKRSLAKTTST